MANQKVKSVVMDYFRFLPVPFLVLFIMLVQVGWYVSAISPLVPRRARLTVRRARQDDESVVTYRRKIS